MAAGTQPEPPLRPGQHRSTGPAVAGCSAPSSAPPNATAYIGAGTGIAPPDEAPSCAHQPHKAKTRPPPPPAQQTPGTIPPATDSTQPSEAPAEPRQTACGTSVSVESDRQPAFS